MTLFCACSLWACWPLQLRATNVSSSIRDQKNARYVRKGLACLKATAFTTQTSASNTSRESIVASAKQDIKQSKTKKESSAGNFKLLETTILQKRKLTTIYSALKIFQQMRNNNFTDSSMTILLTNIKNKTTKVDWSKSWTATIWMATVLSVCSTKLKQKYKRPL